MVHPSNPPTYPSTHTHTTPHDRRYAGTWVRTAWQNLRQTGRISLERVAENIMTCFSWGVARKISWMSRRMSVGGQGRGGV